MPVARFVGRGGQRRIHRQPGTSHVQRCRADERKSDRGAEFLTLGDFQENSVSDIKLSDYPTLPQLTDTAKAIFASGQAAGRNPHMFSKIGDCMTAADYFLNAFGGKDYDLGTFTNLQPVVDYFSTVAPDTNPFKTNAFSSPGLSTDSGFTTSSVLDS